jgi:hypothetical protein
MATLPIALAFRSGANVVRQVPGIGEHTETILGSG